MNIAKHMETILFAAIVVAGGSGIASAAVHKLQQKPAVTAGVTAVATAAAPMPVVTVTAKRLTAADKAAL